LREEKEEKEGEIEKERNGVAGTRRRKQPAVVGGERRRREERRKREREKERTHTGRSRVGGIERVRGCGSYGIALTFDLIPLPASLETPCRPLPSVPRAPTLLRD